MRRDHLGGLSLIMLAAGCGRLLFDPLGAAPEDAPSGPALEIELTCASEAVPSVPFACVASVKTPVDGEVLTWTTNAQHTCGWLAIDPTSGRIEGTPSAGDIGACLGAVTVDSSLRGTATSTWPVTVLAMSVVQIDIGAAHTCALSSAGAVRCWGSNNFGELGYNDSLPVGDGVAGRSIADMGDVPVGGRVIQISLAYRETCALLDTGGVRCWGAGSFSRLGYEHTNDIGDGGVGGSIISNGDIPLGGKATKIAAGGNGGCALMESGGVRCWGLWHGHDNPTQLRGAAIAPAGDVPIGTGPIVDLVGGYAHFCARTQMGTVRCWGNPPGLGYNDSIDVGTGQANHSIIDMGDVPIGGRVVQLSAADYSTCAVLDTGALRCWGLNHVGQAGYGDKLSIGEGDANRSIIDLGDVPVGGMVKSAWAGEEHTCAVMVGGTVRCWGLNLEGQLGRDDTVPVADGTAGRSIIDVGDVPVGAEVHQVVTTDWDTGFSCALLTTGALRCWGNNFFGQLGQDHNMNVGDGGAGGTIISNGDVIPF